MCVCVLAWCPSQSTIKEVPTIAVLGHIESDRQVPSRASSQSFSNTRRASQKAHSACMYARLIRTRFSWSQTTWAMRDANNNQTTNARFADNLLCLVSKQRLLLLANLKYFGPSLPLIIVITKHFLICNDPLGARRLYGTIWTCAWHLALLSKLY